MLSDTNQTELQKENRPSPVESPPPLAFEFLFFIISNPMFCYCRVLFNDLWKSMLSIILDHWSAINRYPSLFSDDHQTNGTLSFKIFAIKQTNGTFSFKISTIKQSKWLVKEKQNKIKAKSSIKINLKSKLKVKLNDQKLLSLVNHYWL